jgi:hypothetical protein
MVDEVQTGSGAPARGSPPALRRPCPTWSPWPRRSATACPSAPAGPAPRWRRRSSPATTPPPTAASRSPPPPPGPCSRRWRPIDAPPLAAQGERLRRARRRLPGRGRGAGARAAARRRARRPRRPPRRSPPALLDAGTRRQRRHAHGAAPRPAAHRLRRRDRRGVAISSRRARGGAVTRHLLEIDDLTADELSRVLDLAERAEPAPVLAGGAPRCCSRSRLRTRHSMEMAVVQLGGHPVTSAPTRSARRARDRRGRRPHAACYHAVICAGCSSTPSSSGWPPSRRCRW